MGTTFIDTKGRIWDCRVNVAVCKRVRSLVGIDLANLSKDTISKLCGDPIVLVDTLFAVVQPQAIAHGVSDTDFGEMMAGDLIEQASAALVDGLIAFFPNARDRQNFRTAFDLTKRVTDRVRETVGAGLAPANLEKLETEAVRRAISGLASTNLPESSASTPTPSLSAS